MSLHPNLRGAAFMAVSMAGFTTNDVITKIVIADINVGQVMMVRGVFATAMILLIAKYLDALRHIGLLLHRAVVLRAIGELGATVAFFVALTELPIANVSAVMQALPLAVTMGAALFLGEPVGWRRWTAISVGFLGVMVIVRPGFAGFNVYTLAALASVGCCVVRDLATKSIPPEIPSVLVSTVTAFVVTIFGALVVVPLGGWVPMGIGGVAQLALAAVLLLFGYQFVIMAMRTGEISFIAPFRYTSLLWAIVLGYLVFSDLPDLAMIVGSALIVGSGLYSLYRERVVSRRSVSPPPTLPNGV